MKDGELVVKTKMTGEMYRVKRIPSLWEIGVSPGGDWNEEKKQRVETGVGEILNRLEEEGYEPKWFVRIEDCDVVIARKREG
jgi:hypothetical protein